uniref:Uncharacterized protein n=1 Tax=Oryza nivara TaxID=4536 RepID=A0A0E0GY82_ORYNI
MSASVPPGGAPGHGGARGQGFAPCRDWGVDELSRYSMAVVNRQQATDDGGGVEEEIRKEIMLGSLLEGARLGK